MVAAIIPARYASTRLPGKPLADIAGKPMIQWVYEAAARAKGIDRVIVATDDRRVEEAARAFGAECQMTDPACASGSDRVGEVADRIGCEIAVNVQGDEPLIEPEVISAAAALVATGRWEIGSAVTGLRDAEELENRNVVKALLASDGGAIYFTRFPVPYSREPAPATGFACYRHLGIYAYRGDALRRIRALPVSALERGESLEQLRALEAGVRIGLAKVESGSYGVDTEEDLEKARKEIWRRRRNTSS